MSKTPKAEMRHLSKLDTKTLITCMTEMFCMGYSSGYADGRKARYKRHLNEKT